MAFPAVDANGFIGCMRFLALPLNREPEDGYELVRQPATGGRRYITKALEMIAREWEGYDVNARIYQIADTPGTYQGSSMDLAYFLANINGIRPLVWDVPQLSGDLWCTGAIRGDGRQPFLESVDDTSFDQKLSAFLGQKDDPVFFVPTLNVLPEHEALCHKFQVPTLTLRQFRQRVMAFAATGPGCNQWVVKIREDELPLLVKTLFKRPKRRYLAILFVLGLLCVFTFFISRSVWKQPGLQMVLVSEQVELNEYSRPLKLNTTYLTLQTQVRPGQHRYVLGFGADGKAKIYTNSQLQQENWQWKIEGPAPSETLMLLVSGDELLLSARADIEQQIRALGRPPSLEPNSQIIWEKDGYQIVRVASRGPARSPVWKGSPWAESVVQILSNQGLTFYGRTFLITD